MPNPVLSRLSLVPLFLVGIGLSTPSRAADVYAFTAQCVNAQYTKTDVEPESSSTKPVPIQCDFLAVTRLADRRTLVEFADRKISARVIGFGAGHGMEPTDEPGVFKLPLSRVYLTIALGGQSVPVAVEDGGFCLFTGGAEDTRQTRSVACTAVIAGDAQRIKFHVEARTTTPGKLLRSP